MRAWCFFLLALLGTCSAIPFFGGGRFNFNNNLQAGGSQDPRQSLFDLLDHLEETHKSLSVVHTSLPVTGFTHEDLKLKSKQAAARVESCQLTICKILQTYSLTAVDIPQRAIRKVESRIPPDGMDDFCFEVVSYNQTKLDARAQGEAISSAYISGTLAKLFDQARAAKVLAAKMMRSLVQKTLDYNSFRCSLNLMKEYIRHELAGYHQAYQQKNYLNGMRMKVRALRSKVGQLKRLSPDKVVFDRKINSTTVEGVRAILVRTRKLSLEHSLANKLTNSELVKDCLEAAKSLAPGRMTTFSKLWGTNKASSLSGYSVVIMKQDRLNTIVLVVNLDVHHEPEDSLSPAVTVQIERLAYMKVMQTKMVRELFIADGVVAP